MKNKKLSNLLFVIISLFFLVLNSCKNSDDSDIIQVDHSLLNIYPLILLELFQINQRLLLS